MMTADDNLLPDRGTGRLLPMILRNSLFLRLLASYLFLVTLLLTAGAIVHNRVISIVAEDSRRLFTSTTTIAVQTIGEQLKQADGTAIRIGEDPRIELLYRMQIPLRDDEYYDLYRANNVVASNRMSDDFIIERLVVVRDNGIVISESFATADFYSRHEDSLRFAGFSNRELVKQALTGSAAQQFWPIQEVEVRGVLLPAICHVRQLPIPVVNDIDAAIVTLFDANSIEALFRPVLDVGGQVSIRDFSGELIANFPLTGQEPPDPVDGAVPGGRSDEKLTSFSLMTPYTGWQVEAQLPDEVIQARVREATASYLFITIIALLLSLLFAAAITKRNVAPVSAIAGMLGIDRSPTPVLAGPYETIQASVTDLLQDNKELHKRVDDQRVLMRDSFIRRLLAGVQESDEWLAAMAAAVGIPGDSGPLAILAFRIEGYMHSSFDSMPHALQELDVARAAVEHTVEQLSGAAYFHHDTPNLAIGLVFEASEETTDHRNVVNELIADTRSMVGRGNIIFSVGAGRQVSGLRDAAVSYRDAVEAVEQAENGAVVWYDQVTSVSQSPYYPTEIQTSLMQQAQAGYGDGVLATLEEIRDRNFRERKLKQDEVRQLLYEMRGTILRLLDRSNIDMEKDIKNLNDAYRSNDLNNSPEDLFENLVSFYSRFCDTASRVVVDRTTRFRQAMVEYVNDNISDHNLCLKMVGVEFGLSEKYLSAVFKEQTLENFGTYIEKRRMENAAKLLGSTNKEIRDIAVEVGYASTNTFHKAFKRWSGMSPGRYRMNSSG